MEIVPAGAEGSGLEPILQDYRRRYRLAETLLLNTLLGALATRQAHALLALEGGRPAGAIVFSRRDEEGHIHILHALARRPAAEAALLARAEEALREGGARRITGSLPLSPDDRLVETLDRHGYQVVPRARLVLDLSGERRAELAGPALPPGFHLTPWQEERHAEAEALIDEAHRDSVDRIAYPEWAGREGTRRLLQAVQAGRFGKFDPALAPMVVGGDELAGLSLNVWHAAFSGQGFILDLAVARAHRRRGLGRALVVATARAFEEAGAVALGLAVTLQNRPAVRLYEGLGFRVEQHFCVFHKDVGPSEATPASPLPPDRGVPGSG